jgi:hypothetical protein
MPDLTGLSDADLRERYANVAARLSRMQWSAFYEQLEDVTWQIREEQYRRRLEANDD